MNSTAMYMLAAIGLFSGVAASATPKHNAWTQGAPMPVAGYAPIAVTFGSVIYVFGGLANGGNPQNTTQIYDPVANTWTQGVPMPNVAGGGVGVAIGKSIYLFGAGDDNGDPYVTLQFRPASNKWTRKAKMPIDRSSTGGAAIGGLAYVAGGNSPTDGYRLANLESYNPKTDTWAELTPMNVGRSELSVGAVGNTLIAAGGYTTDGDTGDNETYTISTGFWTEDGGEPIPLNTSCSAVIKGLFYVLGGSNGAGSTAAQIYNPASDSWASGAAMPQPTAYAGGAAYRGKVYCFGGGNDDQDDVTYNSVQIYTP